MHDTIIKQWHRPTDITSRSSKFSCSESTDGFVMSDWRKFSLFWLTETLFKKLRRTGSGSKTIKDASSIQRIRVILQIALMIKSLNLTLEVLDHSSPITKIHFWSSCLQTSGHVPLACLRRAFSGHDVPCVERRGRKRRFLWVVNSICCVFFSEVELEN